MTDLDRVAEDREVVARIAAILEQRWDPDAAVQRALGAGNDFYRDEAVTVASMIAADARVTEVQGYLRQLEQGALSVSLHPAEERHAIASAVWHIARGL